MTDQTPITDAERVVDLTELEDRISAVERNLSTLITVTREFRDTMVWLKSESEKVAGAVGPLLQMAGPLLGQLLSGEVDPAVLVGQIEGGSNG